MYANLDVSPFHGEDGLLFLTGLSAIEGQTTWRSNDRGLTWDAVLDLTDWYPNAGTTGKLVMLSVPSPTGLTAFMRGGFAYPGGGLLVMLQSFDSGDTWSFLQMCDQSLEYCRNWDRLYYFTNEPDTWFVARYETYTEFEADILRWSGGESFTTVWQETGATSLAISTNYANDHLLYANLYPASQSLNTSFIRSFDGGETWEDASGNGLCPGVGADLHFSPDFANDRTVFALQYGSIFKSIDGGNTWRYLYPPGGAACQSPPREESVWELALSPAFVTDNTMYFTVNDDSPFEARLYVSSDGGETWQPILQIPGTITDLIVAENPPGAPPQSTLPAGGIGRPWTAGWPRRPASRNTYYFPIALARGPQPRPLTLFIEAGTPVPGSYRYRSDDGGLTWQCLNLPPEES
jgi:hypothetical protein